MGLSPIRILVVDDDPMVRSLVVGFLSGADDLALVAAVSDAQAALNVIRADPVDVILLDMVMPGMDGVAATRAIKQVAPDAQIVVLTSLDDGERARAALALGAIGFLTKDVSPEGLLHAVRAAHAGLHVLTRPPFEKVVDTSVAGPTPDAPALTERERAVLTLLCRGASNHAIGAQLFLSPSTVKGAVSAVITKLGASSRLHAVARAHELRLDT